MTIELSEYVIDAIAEAVVKKMQEPKADSDCISRAEVKEGYWLAYKDGKWVYAKCSECETIHDIKTNYCPNCGAKMRRLGE